MSKHNNLTLLSIYKSASLIMSMLISLIGVLVLYGWLANIVLFKSILPNYVPMRANAAIAFILIGISLILQRPSQPRKNLFIAVGKTFGLIVAVFGFISMIRMLSGYPLLIEQLYTFNYSPNDYSRLSPIAAFTFTLIGISLMLLNQRYLIYLNQFMQVIVGLTGLLILTGYCFNFHSQIAIDTATHASLYTATGFILVSFAMLCLQGGKGIMSLFISNTHGGIIARRLVPIVIVVPILLGWLRILGESYHFYDPQTGIEFYSVCITTVLMIVAFVIAKMLMSADRERLTIEKQLRESHTELSDLYQKLRISEERFHNAMDTAPIGMAIVSLEGKYIEVNQSLCQLFGYTKEELSSMTFQQITHPDDLDIDLANSQRLIEGKIPLNQIEKRFIRKNGEIIWVQLTASILKESANGKPLYFIMQIEDVTDRKLTEERIHHLAYHDSLTNLPNRRLLQDRLNHAIDFAKRHQNMMAIMFMDLDKFKYVNDTLGHDIGDELLKAVAARLNAILRSIDTIARISGDEFVIILNELSTAHEAAIIANKIIDGINERFLLRGHEVRIGCSIGITIYPNNGTEVSELMKKADLAMYTAKESGRNQYRYYNH